MPDKALESDIRRFREAEKENAEAQAKRAEWIDREVRTQKRLVSLLQLIADGAAKAGEDLPADILNMAFNLLPNQGVSSEVLRYLQSLQQKQKPIQSEMEKRPVLDPELPKDNKTEFVRQFVKQNSSKGVTPLEIKMAAIAHGVKGVASNFPHTILFKLKEAETVHEDGGRYFAGKK